MTKQTEIWQLIDKSINIYALMQMIAPLKHKINKKDLDEQYVLIQDAIDTLSIVELNLWVMYSDLVKKGDKK